MFGLVFDSVRRNHAAAVSEQNFAQNQNERFSLGRN